MNKLGTEDFIKFLVQTWNNAPYEHKFSTLNSKINGNFDNGNVFKVKSLAECLELYQWNSKGYSENKTELNALSYQLHCALNSNNTEETGRLFREIYKWGGVRLQTKGHPNISQLWLEQNIKNDTLVEKINVSKETIFIGKDFGRFDGLDLIMNSGFTKVVSLASTSNRELIIFDGRVGAALGHLAMMAIKSSGHNSISNDLLFPWGTAQSQHINRDPSNETIKFPRLFGGNRSHYKHASAMSVSSSIVRSVSTQLNIDPRDFEAALFMWGYSV